MLTRGPHRHFDYRGLRRCLKPLSISVKIYRHRQAGPLSHEDRHADPLFRGATAPLRDYLPVPDYE